MSSTIVLRCITLVAMAFLPLAGLQCSAAPSEGGGVSEGQGVTVQAGPVHPSASSGLCLDVVGQSTVNGAGVQVWSCSGNANQQWAYDGARLTIYGGSKCLDVTGGNTANGTKLQIWDCTSGNANQKWTLSGQTLQWTGHGKCMDLTAGVAQNGTPIQSWDCTSNNKNQQWTLGGQPGSGSSSGGSSGGGSSSSGSSSGSGGSSGGSSGGAPPPPARQSLVWVWIDYQNTLAAVAAHASSFTHVSPSLYQVNYGYTSGVAALQAGGDDFDGLSSAQIASKVHATGMKCIPLIQAGAGNGGTDQGIQNIVGNSGGAQAAFISAMVQEAVNKGYDGYSLDWETGGGTTYAGYGPGMTAFLGAFASALHARGMVLQLVVGDWYVKQSNCSGGSGFVDLQAAAAKVDQVITMDYAPSLGSPTASCNASVANPGNCGGDFGSSLNLMCAYVPLEKISIGLDSDPNGGNNDIAGACITATEKANIPAVAIWPEYNTRGPNGSYAFIDTTGISPAGTTWFALLSGFLSGK
jgi:hypothetical protein